MSKVIVKTKDDKSHDCYRLLASTTESIYEPPTSLVSDTIAYSPEASLETGEWYAFVNFSKSQYMLEILAKCGDTVDYETIQMVEIEQIEYVLIQEHAVFYFQNIGKSKLVKKKGFFHMGLDFQYKSGVTTIVLDDCPDAIYDPSVDTLYFRNLSRITKIFPEIGELYREATLEETQEFLKQDCIQLYGGFNAGKVSTANRKRIGLAVDTFCRMSEHDRKMVLAYIQDYCPKMRQENGRFAIGSEKELKEFLYGVNQRYYTTVVGHEKRIAQSIIPIISEAQSNG